jgi:uncharacterized protein (TIGR03435 family)
MLLSFYVGRTPGCAGGPLTGSVSMARNRSILCSRVGVFACAFLLSGQTHPEFDVATIKPAAPSTDGRTHVRMSTDTDTGKLIYSNVNLKEVIGKAWKVQQYQINGPAWLGSDRFDIIARFAPHSTDDQVPLMLQSLLSDRFKLILHRETKELPVYALTVGAKGPKFKTAESASGITSNTTRTQRHVLARMSMDGFAEFLSGEAGRLVLNKTGLTGSYEMPLDWAAENAPTGNDVPTLPSLFTALQEQLGLKLEPAKGPVETLIVDHADRTPTDN